MKKYSHYCKEGYQAYGVSYEDMLAHKKTLLEAHDALGLSGFLDLGDLLFQNPHYEMGSFAIILTAAFREKMKPKEFACVGHWLDAGVRNWAHCDVLASELTGWCLSRGSVGMDALEEWRAAPVSLLPLVKTMEDCAPLLPVRHREDDPAAKGARSRLTRLMFRSVLRTARKQTGRRKEGWRYNRW